MILFPNVATEGQTRGSSCYLSLFRRLELPGQPFPRSDGGEETAGEGWKAAAPSRQRAAQARGRCRPPAPARLLAEGAPRRPRHARLRPGPAAQRRGPRRAAPQAGDAARDPRPASSDSPGPPHPAPPPSSTPGRRSLEPPAQPHLAAAGKGPSPRAAGSGGAGTSGEGASGRRPPAQRKEGVGETIRAERRRGAGGAPRFGGKVPRAVPRTSPGSGRGLRGSSRGSRPSPGGRGPGAGLGLCPARLPPAQRSGGAARYGHRIPGAGGGGSATSALVRQRREFPARAGRGLIPSPRPAVGVATGRSPFRRGGVRGVTSPPWGRRAGLPSVPPAVRHRTPVPRRPYCWLGLQLPHNAPPASAVLVF
ncbi:translation initiation factor IF-2-like [Falco peregrinus]|uniref:translation initiation factor IF-2-like n=1 Tax=Falco peregrinus TaxID=8954 RepID=UPI00247986FC|nr:translation initiation factor IF-2-like [Falco peregrinus]